MKKVRTKFKLLALILLALIVLTPLFVSTKSQAQISSSDLDNLGYILDVVVDTNTQLPGGQGPYSGGIVNEDPVSIGGKAVAFIIRWAEPIGIYISVSGKVSVIADTNTPIPGGIGNFQYFSNLVSLGGKNLAFKGFDSNSYAGIYGYINGELVVIADRNTRIPGGIGNFTHFNENGFTSLHYFEDAQLTNVQLVFHGTRIPCGHGGPCDDIPSQGGLYLYDNGRLSVIVDRNTQMPGQDLNFHNFRASSVVQTGGEGIAFIAGRSSFGQLGIYKFKDGVISLIVDQNTLMPGYDRTTFSATDELRYVGQGYLAFVGNAEEYQKDGVFLYSVRDRALSLVANDNTLVPGEIGGNFKNFKNYLSSNENGTIAFIASTTTGHEGIYSYSIYDDDMLSELVNTNTPIPGGMGNFTSFSNLTIEEDPVFTEEGDLVFHAIGQTIDIPQQGLYSFSFATERISLIVDAYTPIPDGEGNFRNFWRYIKHSRNDIVFRGTGFSAGGLYRASKSYALPFEHK